tara:strand:- start:27 stop:392 length:366 start_codon:yes stop_codon:yes gene_type:complete
MAVNPFDLVKAINEKKPVDDPTDYIPYLSNIAFSYSLDTVMLANEMNCHPNMPPECQFDFMNGTVQKGRRYNKWYKEGDNPHLELVMEYYNYSKQKALQALQVLTQDNIRDIIEQMDKGGR